MPLKMNEPLVTDITSKPPLFPNLGEAWARRGLALMLARRNLKLRSAQTVLGHVWIVLQPLLLTGMLTLVFGMMLSVPSDGLPYILFAFAGTVMWFMFLRTVTDTAMSIAASGGIILKVYFPRILIPLSVVLTIVADLIPSYLLLIVTVVLYGMWPGWPILLSPFVLLLGLVLAFAIGLWTTMIDAIYRDVRMLIPSLLQLLFFCTPVMYAASVVPQGWEWIFRLNPLVGLLRIFRWTMIDGASSPTFFDVAWTFGLAGALLVGGLFIFARLEQFAVDRI